MSESASATREFQFGTKADTLARLAHILRTAVVLPIETFTVTEWRDSPEQVIEHVWSQPWARQPLVVRSSSYAEDDTEFSNAGHYLSELNVLGKNELRSAVDRVVAAFETGHTADQVLVQPQLMDAVASGVASSCEPSCGAPCRVVNWAEGPDTFAVTSGRSTVLAWYFLDDNPQPPAPSLAGIPPLFTELESLTDGQPFEFEFGIPRGGGLVLFQVRPLARATTPIAPEIYRAAVTRCQLELRSLQRERPPALGPRTVLGVMPDWNPAEMIGRRPRPLALSLYRELITDSIWAESRRRYGYRDLRGTPLLVDLCGLPYIDTRASFTSLIPASIPHDGAARLATHYVQTLRNNPHLHDKVEFTIALPSYHFTVDTHIRHLNELGVLSADDSLALQTSLRDLTIRMMSPGGPYRQDLHDIEELSRLPLVRAETFSAERIRWLVDVCKRKGTLPFSGIARAAFAATALVRSLVDLDVFSPEEADALLSSSRATSTAVQTAFHTLDRGTFLERYGHLRPGTYDILSPRYDETPHRYFDWPTATHESTGSPVFRPGRGHVRHIRALMSAHLLPLSTSTLLQFIVQSVAAREHGKLEFSRLVSEILVEARRAGEWLGFTVAEMSYADIHTLCSLTGVKQRDRAVVAAAIDGGKSRYALTESLCTPHVLSEPAELSSFVTTPGEVNFVTRARVTARVADVAAGDDPAHAIAMISAADPGYDWIFTRHVIGLVTAFGGINSHMAIRARELGIPAAIGVGESQFKRWLRAEALEIDAAAKSVHPVALEVGHPRDTGRT